ncbi:MAG TPA: SpoIVB peptidase S55 domain-containing protein [bacterium]|nr:SpoIVB peptidase S55 domain-containing protein [bacterium]
MRGTMRAVAAIVAVGLGLVITGLPPAGADPQTFLPVSAVHAGMRGYGLTVIQGTTIQRFDITVLGVLKGEGASETDLILFRASGPVITRAGGTASGMSGSPIFLGGRLAGALSYGYHFPGPDADLSLATPIEEMLKMLAPPAPAARPRGPAPSGGGTAPRASWPREYRSDAPIPTFLGPLRRVLVVGSTAEAAAFNAHPSSGGTAAVAPATVPMTAAGVTPGGMRVLERAFKRFNLVPHQSYAGARNFVAPPIEPGASLGVELVRGDVEVGAIGTATYRRGAAVLGFGHPLMNAGSTSLFLTSAWIDTIVRSLDFPFKEGSFGPAAGTLTQDRMTGIAGALGRFPRAFAIRVHTRDLDTGASHSYGAQVVRRQDLAEGLVPTTMLSLIQRGLDRVSGGSAAIRITLRARNLKQPVVREDLAFDVGDIATAAALDVPAATQLLFGNFFEEMDPVDITVDVAVTTKPNMALLVGARPNVRTVHAGDRVQVEVRVRPFGGGEPEARTIAFTVPRDFPEGPAFLLVGTAGALNDSASPADKFLALVALEGTPSGAESLASAIDQFENQGKNTDLIVQLVPEAVLTAVGANANPSFNVPAGTTLETDWVVLGKYQIPITVK